MSNELPDPPRKFLVEAFNEVPGNTEEVVRAAAISMVARAYMASGGNIRAAGELVKDALAVGLGAMTVAHEHGLSAQIIAFPSARGERRH